MRQPIRKIAYTLVAAFITVAAGCDNPQQQQGQGHDSPPESSEGEESPSSASPHQEEQPMNMEAAEEFRPDFAHEELVILDEPVDVPAEFSNDLEGLLDQYLTLTAAFAADDVSQADAVAGQMRVSLSEVVGDALADEASAAWASHREGLETALHQLESADTIDVKRQHLSHISEALYCALASFGGVERSVYVSYCPMALDEAGAYWLASTPEIANPYFGESMLRCGEVRHEL
jgi:Cu(I)/Ag(I) efflux system membrane fusion protein